MTASPSFVESDPDRMRALSSIGAVAARLGVSERTLRYYEEVGLITPTAHRPGGTRLYGEEVIERVRRIRDLQALMGFNLEEIRSVLSAEDRLAQIKQHYKDADYSEQAKMLEEATSTLKTLLERVDSKIEALERFRDALASRLQRIQNKSLNKTEASTIQT